MMKSKIYKFIKCFLGTLYKDKIFTFYLSFIGSFSYCYASIKSIINKLPKDGDIKFEKLNELSNLVVSHEPLKEFFSYIFVGAFYGWVFLYTMFIFLMIFSFLQFLDIFMDFDNERR